MHGRIAFDREGLLDLHAAGLGHAAEIVAHQIDDHQVLGLVLDRSGEFGGELGILLGGAATRTGAFHRLDLGRTALQREEQLGAEREQPVRSVEHQPAIAGLCCRTDRGVKRHGIAPGGPGQAEGQVRLVDVPGADGFLQPVEHLEVGPGRNLRVERADRGVSAARPVRQPLWHLGRGDRFGRVEQAEPHERTVGAGACRRQRAKARLQRETGFVSEVARQRPAALPPCGFRFREHGFDLAGRARDEHLARILEQMRVHRAFAARVVEEDEGPARHDFALAAALAKSIAWPRLGALADGPIALRLASRSPGASSETRSAG